MKLKNLLLIWVIFCPYLFFASAIDFGRIIIERDTIFMAVDFALKKKETSKLFKRNSKIIDNKMNQFSKKNLVFQLVDVKGKTVEILEYKNNSIKYFESIENGDYFIQFVIEKKKYLYKIIKY